eukprot:1916719-Alexandrium_andersonii.AAC.1
MSASLVGSEMCIRDRLFGVGAYRAVYNELKGITVTATSQASSTVTVVTDERLQEVGGWSGLALDTSNSKSSNE